MKCWLGLRKELETHECPFTLVWEHWKRSPFTHFNHKVDPTDQASWPTPWEIIIDNVYDDFTRSLMIATSLAYTNRYAASTIELVQYSDERNVMLYNIVQVDSNVAINYSDAGPIPVNEIPQNLNLLNKLIIK